MKTLFKMAVLSCCFLFTQSIFAADPAPANAPIKNDAARYDSRDTRYSDARDGRYNDQNVRYGDRNIRQDQTVYGDQYAQGYAPQGPAQGGGCPEDHPCPDQALNDCWCLYVHYEPCYYTTQRCVEEQIPCTKKCWRKVPRYYEVKKCKMVPQYYCETRCKYENECYEVADTKCCKKVVCDTHCKYVPKYYWKHVCGNAECPQKGCAQ